MSFILVPYISCIIMIKEKQGPRTVERRRKKETVFQGAKSHQHSGKAKPKHVEGRSLQKYSVSEEGRAQYQKQREEIQDKYRQLLPPINPVNQVNPVNSVNQVNPVNPVNHQREHHQGEESMGKSRSIQETN